MRLLLTGQERDLIVSVIAECKASAAAYDKLCRAEGLNVPEDHPVTKSMHRADRNLYKTARQLWDPIFRNMTHDFDWDMCMGLLKSMLKNSHVEEAA